MSKKITKSLRFIPFRRQDIIEMCLRSSDFSEEQLDQFRHVTKLLNSLIHFEYHQLLETFKQVYAPLNPDADTYTPPFTEEQPVVAGEKAQKAEIAGKESQETPPLEALLAHLLDKANYEKITKKDLAQALEEDSLLKIRLQVNFDDFDEVLFFCRGERQRQETLKQFFGLRQKILKFTNYERVVVYLKFKDDLETELPNCRPGSTLLKLFQNVPKADLEMLFPNTRIRMRSLDKWIIGVPAAIGGIIVVSTKLGGSLILLASLVGYWLGATDREVTLDKAALLALLAGAGALAVHFWKQFNNFKNRKLKFAETLTRNLYFKNLDNNAGVFHRLLDEAEEEEGKEAILAYYFLLSAQSPMTAQELDHSIEQWLQQQLGSSVDFEIDDALQKLQRFGLITLSKEDGLSAVDMADALVDLDKQWDSIFSYS